MKISGYSFYEMKFVKIDLSGTIRIRLDLWQAGLMVSFFKQLFNRIRNHRKESSGSSGEFTNMLC